MDEDSISQLVSFARALRKVNRASKGGRVTLDQAECKAIIWGVQMLRGKDEA